MCIGASVVKEVQDVVPMVGHRVRRRIAERVSGEKAVAALARV